MNKIWIYGVSEDSQIILETFFSKSEKVAGFIDDDYEKKDFLGFPVIKLHMVDLADSELIIAVNDNNVRKSIADKIDIQVASAIHPSAIVSPCSSLGKGSVVLSKSVINSGSHIGEFCLINNSRVDQNCSIGDFVNIGSAARICKKVTIGSLTSIGNAATIYDNINIGSNVRIGARCIVVKDIQDNSTVLGVLETPNKSQPKKNKSDVYIIGASGYGREIESWVSQSENFNALFEVKGFLDDNLTALNGYPSEHRIIAKIDDFEFKREDFVLLGISDPTMKEKIVHRLRGKVKFLSFVSEKAITVKDVIIGEGTIIAPGCSISTNVTIGRFVSVIIGTIIGHDTEIADFSSIMPNVNISGNTKIGNNVLIGSGSTIVPGKTIGNNSKISAGSVLFTNVKANSTVYGNPARSIPNIKMKPKEI